MAITFPLTLPPQGIRRVVFRGLSVVGLQPAPLTLEQTTYVWQGDGWEADVELPPMTREVAAPWVAFLMALNGMEGSFLMPHPVNTPLGTWAGSPLVNGAHAAGVKTVAIDGLTPSIATGKACDWLQFGSGLSTRLHMLVQDFTANGSGQANLEIWPRLRAPLANDAALVFTGAQGLWKLASNVRDWSVDLARIHGVSFSCVEARDG